jgi:hypothetical protein
LRSVGHSPEALFMGLDDRAAYRQAHPHATGFLRKQRIEDNVGLPKREPDTARRRPNHRSREAPWRAPTYRGFASFAAVAMSAATAFGCDT